MITPIFSGSLDKMISIVTRGDDELFPPFVNSVLAATVHAAEKGITKSKSEDMPLFRFFGEELRWMFRDVIQFQGNYDEIYNEAHDTNNVETVDRGLNWVMPPKETIAWWLG